MNILQSEVALRWAKEHFDFTDVDGGIEFLLELYDVALEAGHQVPEATIVNDGALRDKVTCSICGEVEDTLHLHVVERGIMGNKFAEALEVDVIAPRGLCDLHGFASVFPEGDLLLEDDVLKWFA